MNQTFLLKISRLIIILEAILKIMWMISSSKIIMMMTMISKILKGY